MNCQICQKPVDEHGEGRKTDRCIAERLGLNITLYTPTGDFYLDTAECCEPIPHYSSPTMSAETWGLAKEIVEGDDDWGLSYNYRTEEYYFNLNDFWGVPAPTPTLAICRAFLAMEEK